MNMRTRTRLFAVVGMLGVMAMAAACVPPPAPSAETWTFKGTQVTVNNSQDETCVLGICANRSDEPYLINIGFRVKIGQPGSAATQVANARSSAPQDVGAGSSRTLTGAQQATVTWGGITPLDILDLANTNNKLEVVGVYSWAAEEDFVGIGVAANDVADILRQVLNDTLASETLPSDAGFILDLIIDNLGDAFTLLLQNIPLLGLGDDTLGAGMYVGIGAKGTLADIIDSAIGETPFPSFPVPVLSLPPDIEGGAFFTTDGPPRNFTQGYSGAGGQHTYNYQVAEA
jgi:hypothetical protein